MELGIDSERFVDTEKLCLKPGHLHSYITKAIRQVLSHLQPHRHRLCPRKFEQATAKTHSQLCSSCGKAWEGEGDEQQGAVEQQGVRGVPGHDEGGQDCQAGWQQSAPSQVLLIHPRDLSVSFKEGEPLLSFYPLSILDEAEVLFSLNSCTRIMFLTWVLIQTYKKHKPALLY